MIDLWIVDLDDFKVTDSTLSAEEKERAGRYHFDIHRNRFISRRSILRLILSKYLDCSPAAVKFKYSSLGKPSVDLKSTESIHFNVSHSRSKAVIAITSDEQVGVDIEFIDPEINSELISSHFFADSEIATIKSANAEEKPDTFFKFWTIKEAFIKAVGKGLTFPLNEVIVRDIDSKPRLDFVDQHFNKQEWSVKLIDQLSEYWIAIAVPSAETEVVLNYDKAFGLGLSEGLDRS